MNFTLNPDDISASTFYTNELKSIQDTEEFVLNVDCEHLYMHDVSLYT